MRTFFRWLRRQSIRQKLAITFLFLMVILVLVRTRYVTKRRMLLVAVVSGNKQQVRYLLDHGADPNARMLSSPAVMPLPYEIGVGASEVRASALPVSRPLSVWDDMLIAIKPPYWGNDGSPVLAVALYQGQYSIAEDLIHHGADVNARTENGETILTEVKLLVDNPKMIEILKRYGAKE